MASSLEISKNFFITTVFVCFSVTMFLSFFWQPSLMRSSEARYGKKNLPRRPDNSSSSGSYTLVDIEDVLALDHDYEFEEVFRNPEPQKKFTVSQFDEFHGASRLPPTRSKHNAKIVQTCQRNKNSTKKISCCKTVMFVGMCGGWSGKLRKFPFKFTCPGSKACNKSSTSSCGCTVVVDHVSSPSAIKNADLVIFSHISGYLSNTLWKNLIEYKHKNQRWVFSTIESPIYVRGLLPPWNLRNDTYDFSDTFYSDADVPTPYGYYEPFRVGKPRVPWNSSEHILGKNKLISWTASHCETLQWDRTKFAQDLAKIAGVDTYGRCGKLKVCKNTWNANCSTEFENLMKTYKFSLSLENSCCREYITEKFWKMLDLGTVPVVVGPPVKDFEQQAPPGSYIHADQFSSMKDLAYYLRYLDKNDTAYMEYFSWKSKGRVFSDPTPDHYKRAVSDKTLCSLIGLLLADIEASKSKLAGHSSSRKVFDVYSSSWQGRCDTCGHHDWLKKYEFSPEHERKSKNLWH